MIESKKISVCIATYNGEKYIREQIDSILFQLSANDEIVVSDDNSTDDTLRIIQEIQDNRIKIIQNNLKKGVTHNFANALMNAKGDYIFLSDQDDIWLPNKVQTCVKELIVNDLIVSNCIAIDEYGNIVYSSYFDIAKSGKGFLKNFYRSTYLGCCLAFKKEILNEILPIPNSLLLFHDWWFGFISEICFKVKFIDTPCMYYRRHGETTSKTLSKSDLTLFNKIWYRLQILYLGCGLLGLFFIVFFLVK
jgi:glycosyltransferase involved in cell wall biosynthesis